MVKDYECDNFSNDRCFCHKGKTGCMNMQLVNLMEHINKLVDQSAKEDAKNFCDKIIEGVKNIRKGVR